MEFSISGLTPKQKMLMDIMWSMETAQEVKQFIDSLPKADQIDATGLMQCMIYEALESNVETYEQCGFPEVTKLLEQYRI